MTSIKPATDIYLLLENLKITKPVLFSETRLHLAQSTTEKNEGVQVQSDFHAQTLNESQRLPQFNYRNSQLPFWKQSQQNPSFKTHPATEYESVNSVVNDNYDNPCNYSFYELQSDTEPQKSLKTQPNSQQFSFCHHFQQETLTQSNDDSLNRFSSIVDRLKTEADPAYFYDNDDSYQTSQTGRDFQKNPEPYFSQNQTHTTSDRLKTQYFSGSTLKTAQKSYKTISKRTIQPSFPKSKAQPIYAKLILNSDKENNHQNSNLCPKTSVITSLTTKKSTYSSVMKKPFNPISKTSQKLPQQSPLTKGKVKDLNEKIRKENQIIYASELKEKHQEVSPLQSFKKSTIQPHKFSTYKAKLFG